MPSIHTIKEWYKKKHENLKGFADWIFSREKRDTFSLEDIREKVREYQKLHPKHSSQYCKF